MLDRHLPDPRESPTEHREPSSARAPVRGNDRRSWLAAPGSNRDPRIKSPLGCLSPPRPSKLVDHRSNALRRLCLQGTAALLCMAQKLVHLATIRTCEAPRASRLQRGGIGRSPTGALSLHRAAHDAAAMCCPMKMVRAPGIEPGLRAWRAHVLPLNTTPASWPGRGARRAGRRQPARRRAPRPGPLAIHVVKERPPRRHPTSDEVGVLQER